MTEISRLWAGLIEWGEDWQSIWRRCNNVDFGLALEQTAFAQVVRRYMKPARASGGEGQRAEYPQRLCEPKDDLIRATVQRLCKSLKYKPNEKALVATLIKTKNTVGAS